MDNKAALDVSVAKYDLVFFKVLEIADYDHFVTPFMHKYVELDRKYYMADPHFSDYKTYHTMEENSDMFNRYLLYRGITVAPIITGDAFHLFKNLEDAVKYIDEISEESRRLSQDLVIVKAIIPNGTEYVEGSSPFEIWGGGINNQPYIRMYSSIATKSVTYKAFGIEDPYFKYAQY